MQPSALQDVSAADAASDAQALPTDTHFGRLWGLHNTGQNVNGTVGTADCDIDAPEAWVHEVGRRHVVVAVIDTGCDLDHRDLAANILPRGNEDWNFADGPDKVPEDAGQHGTNMSGTVAALRNGSGVVGVVYGVRASDRRWTPSESTVELLGDGASRSGPSETPRCLPARATILLTLETSSGEKRLELTTEVQRGG